MPEHYCPLCEKVTPHKAIMRRCQQEPCGRWQDIQRFLSQLAKGKHYYEMERHLFCRVCNHHSFPKLETSTSGLDSSLVTPQVSTSR
jgi:ribosomal protein L44E